MANWSKTLFRVEVTFPAPLDFVYRWLTDFSPRDAEITGETFRRKLLERSESRVVFEDLAVTPSGWSWLRNVVDLQPPDRWHLEAVGNSLDARADYRLIPRSASQTVLVMTWRLRPGLLGGSVPPKAEIEASLRHVWESYVQALENDLRPIRLRARRSRDKRDRS